MSRHYIDFFHDYGRVSTVAATRFSRHSPRFYLFIYLFYFLFLNNSNAFIVRLAICLLLFSLYLIFSLSFPTFVSFISLSVVSGFIFFPAFSINAPISSSLPILSHSAFLLLILKTSQTGNDQAVDVVPNVLYLTPS